MMIKMMRIWLGLVGLSLMMVIDGLHPAAAVQLVGNEIAITTISGEEDVPAVAHSSIDNRFLVAFTDERNLATTDIDIFMQVIEADGTLLGGNLPLSTAPKVQKIPAIGYSPVNNSFLTAWSDRRNSQGFIDDLFGQRVSPDGNLVGTDFAISTAFRNQGGPVLAYDSLRDRFLAVWTDTRTSNVSGRDIFGQLVNADGTLAGTLVGENFSISTENTDQFRASAAYSEANDLFLAVWVDCRDNPGSCSQSTQVGTMIFGQFIAGNGALVDESFPITSVMANHTQPGVVYNNVDGQFLVVWEDGRNLAVSGKDIFGQRVSGNGFLLGNNLPISAAMADQVRPSMAHSPTENQFLVVWSDTRNQSTSRNDIFGQAVGGNGTLVGASFAISVARRNQDRPVVSYNPIDNEFLVVWRDSRNNPFDIFGQRVTLAP